MVIVTRTARFNAAARTDRPDLSEAANRDASGPWAAAFPRGHDYRLEVSLRGDPDPATGMVVNLQLVRDTLQRTVVDLLDNRFLNEEVSHFRTTPPTLENLTLFIVGLLQGAFPPAALHRVRLWEREDFYAEWQEDSRC